MIKNYDFSTEFFSDIENNFCSESKVSDILNRKSYPIKKYAEDFNKFNQKTLELGSPITEEHHSRRKWGYPYMEGWKYTFFRNNEEGFNMLSNKLELIDFKDKDIIYVKEK